MQRLFVFVSMLALSVVVLAVEDNSIGGSSDTKINTKEELVATVIMNCFNGERTAMNCVRGNVLRYLDTVVPQVDEKNSGDVDEKIFDRVQRYLKNNEFKLQLPELFFQKATLTLNPGQGLEDFDISFPSASNQEGGALSEARSEMRAKGVLPLLLLLKLKLKALTPIMVALIGMKALKALILSKIAIVLVVGFLVVQLCKKAGMMPMTMMMPPMEPPTPSPYGAPGAPAPPSTMSSYEPSWEPSAGGPYARIGDGHPLAYNAYALPSTQTIH